MKNKCRLSIKELARQAQFQGESFTGAAATWRRKFLSGGHRPIKLTRLEHFNQSSLFPMAATVRKLIWKSPRCDSALPQKHPAMQKVHNPLVVFIRFHSIWSRKATNAPRMSQLPLLLVKPPIKAKKESILGIITTVQGAEVKSELWRTAARGFYLHWARGRNKVSSSASSLHALLRSRTIGHIGRTSWRIF